MDPDELLARLLETARRVQALEYGDDAEMPHTFDPGPGKAAALAALFVEHLRDAGELANGLLALDEWLAAGNFPPNRWRR